jgi:hypothetical protein
MGTFLSRSCSACPHVHGHTPPQVTRTAEPPWIPLEQGELQLKLQLTGRVAEVLALVDRRQKAQHRRIAPNFRSSWALLPAAPHLSDGPR